MPRKQKTIHYLYKTTCKVTGRYYIGMHSTSNLEDGYMGSGKRLRYSIRKHGEDNHEKEILEFFDSRELLVEVEKAAITPDMLVDNMRMNLRGGGTGGFTSREHMLKTSSSGGKKFAERLKNDKVFRVKHKARMLTMLLTAHKNGKIKYDNFLNLKHSDKTKQLMSNQRKNTGLNIKNSQYGTCWITNGTENKKIKKDINIPEGWYKGRIVLKKKSGDIV